MCVFVALLRISSYMARDEQPDLAHILDSLSLFVEIR